jgi:predicted MPP superfamily phosphohydrolase
MISRRHFLRFIAGLGAFGASTTAYGFGVEPARLRVTRYDIAPPQWPADFNLKIAVITDLHACDPWMSLERIEGIVERTNRLKADVVVLLGDYVAGHRQVTRFIPANEWAPVLGGLKAPLGVHAILGNHDWWFHEADIRLALKRVSIPVMENDAVLLGEPGARFWLAGIGDQLAVPLGQGRFRGADDLPATLAGIGTDEPVILMVHEPDIFTKVPDRVSLTLAGHTHGGQIRLPFVWPAFVPSQYGARFAYGHIVEGGRDLIVSGGLGTSVVPMRVGVPPEIVHIELG